MNLQQFPSQPARQGLISSQELSIRKAAKDLMGLQELLCESPEFNTEHGQFNVPGAACQLVPQLSGDAAASGNA